MVFPQESLFALGSLIIACKKLFVPIIYYLIRNFSNGHETIKRINKQNFELGRFNKTLFT